MAIRDQSYQHWDGGFRRTLFPWAPMVPYHYRLLMRRKLVWLLLFMSFVPAIVFSILLYVTWQQTRDGGFGSTVLWEILKRPIERSGIEIGATSLNDPGPGFLADVTRYGLLMFLMLYQSFVVLMTVSTVGAGLIARDIRSNALEIYLTKPISALDYVLGKLAVIGIFVFLVTFVPSCLLYVVAASLWPGYLGATWIVLFELLTACAVAAVVNGAVILGLSSLAKSSRFATVIWFALCFLSAVTANTLSQTTGEPMFYLLSYRAAFEFAFDDIFGGDSLMSVFVAHAHEIPRWIPWATLLGWMGLSAGLLRRTVRAVERS